MGVSRGRQGEDGAVVDGRKTPTESAIALRSEAAVVVVGFGAVLSRIYSASTAFSLEYMQF